jgi:hypothetical protein
VFPSQTKRDLVRRVRDYYVAADEVDWDYRSPDEGSFSCPCVEIGSYELSLVQSLVIGCDFGVDLRTLRFE